MSRLDELIQEFCPNGVEYISLDQCTEKVDNIKWKNATGTYQYIDLTSVDRYTHIITETQVINASNAPSRAQQIVKAGDILLGATRPMLKRYCMIDMQFDSQICSTGFCVLRPSNELVLNRWLYHNISSTNFFDHVEKYQKGASYPAIADADVKMYKIPVPPLEVQREIVRILDNFTELTAELTARKKQYEFYRDKLLSFDTLIGSEKCDIHWTVLSKIADIGTGSSNTDEGLEEGLYPFYVRSPEPLRKNEYEYDETAIITAGDGVGVGKVYHYVEGKYALHQRAYRIHINTPDVMPRYYYHYMRSTFLPYIQKTMYHGSVASIRRPMLNEFPVPVPSLDVQERLVHVLDNFDTICSDLNIGLPAEIEARKKQYEFYRDKLLTFDIASATISGQTDRQTDRQTDGLIKLFQYVFGIAYVTLDSVIVSLNTGLNPRRFFALNTDDAENCYVTIRELQNNHVVFNEKTDRINDEALRLCNNRSNLEAGDVLFSGTGTIGEVALVESTPENWNIKEGVYTIKPNQQILDSKYLMYLLRTKPIRTAFLQKSAGGTVKSVPMGEMRKLVIPLPSLDVQREKVAILDRFDALCNDISSGLPAEIAARHKQYEYYRDKLLTFKEKTVQE